MDPIRDRLPWYDRLSNLLGKREARGASKHVRGTTLSPNTGATRSARKAKRYRTRVARAITRNWPRKRKK